MKESSLGQQLDPEHTPFDEEREGLLSGKEHFDSEHDESRSDVPRTRVYVLASVLALLMLGAIFAPPLLKTAARPVADFNSRKLRTNGTHAFRKTALIVSIDGLRYVLPSVTYHLY